MLEIGAEKRDVVLRYRVYFQTLRREELRPYKHVCRWTQHGEPEGLVGAGMLSDAAVEGTRMGKMGWEEAKTGDDRELGEEDREGDG